jgi:hypothetical protein
VLLIYNKYYLNKIIKNVMSSFTWQKQAKKKSFSLQKIISLLTLSLSPFAATTTANPNTPSPLPLSCHQSPLVE